MAKFQFVKGVATRTKNQWSVRAKVEALSMVKDDTTATQVIAAIADSYGIDISETPSYIKNAGSHIGRFRTEIAKRLAKGDQEAVAACQEFGVAIAPVEE
jgi:hypothetical protein